MDQTLRWEGGTVAGSWHPAPKPAAGVLVLAHGAGNNKDNSLLVAVGEALASRGISVLRFNFPYMEAGRKAPDPGPRLESCYRSVAAYAAGRHERVFLGGKSLGGRIASQIVAQGTPVSGLVFLGYPLHPPGRPERLRDEHLAAIDVPMLFCQGTRDPFADSDLLRSTLDRLPTATLVPIEGGDHSLRVRGRPESDVYGEISEVVAKFVA